MPRTVIMKFGGASFSHQDNFDNIADIIIDRSKNYDRTVVVVSAMAGMTDVLIEMAYSVHPLPPNREKDMLISVGERISMSLLSMALSKKNIEAVSFTGSQSGIITSSIHSNAQIIDVRPYRLIDALESGKVAIVAGFQGVSEEHEITTLGRGGSDTTAVALAAALKADKVEFFKDVLGVYDIDPNKHTHAKMHNTLNYEEALEIAKKGAKVLHSRCIELAEKNNIPLKVLSFKKNSYKKDNGTTICSNNMTCKEKTLFEN